MLVLSCRGTSLPSDGRVSLTTDATVLLPPSGRIYLTKRGLSHEGTACLPYGGNASLVILPVLIMSPLQGFAVVKRSFFNLGFTSRTCGTIIM